MNDNDSERILILRRCSGEDGQARRLECGARRMRAEHLASSASYSPFADHLHCIATSWPPGMEERR